MLKTPPPNFHHVLETDRLILRIPKPGDGRMLCDGVNHSFQELNRWMDWARTRPTIADSEGVAREMAHRAATMQEVSYALLHRDDATFCGMVGVHHIAWEVPAFEIGYWLRTSATGAGLATEAVRAVLAYLFDDLHAERVEIRCDARNRRSAAIAERCGFTLDGRLRHDRRANDGTLVDSLVYGLLRADYVTANGQP